MAMGTRQKRERQQGLWIATSEVVETPANAFYDRLNQILDDHKFDAKVERLCRKFYKKSPYGRPSMAPGVYFRSLLIGYFEGLDSERGIAWRTADSLSLRKILDEAGLVSGRTVSVDATTLEANAALKSIVRRDNGQSYNDYLKDLAQAAGIENPTREQLARLDRKRKKKGSNREWMSPSDPDARITKMKDGRTHLAHKAEHAVDLTSGALLALTLQPANAGDTTTIQKTLEEAQIVAREINEAGVEEVVADKGYHSGAVLNEVHDQQVRSYIPELERGRRNW